MAESKKSNTFHPINQFRPINYESHTKLIQSEEDGGGKLLSNSDSTDYNVNANSA